MGLPVNEGGIKRDWRKIENLKLDILSFLVSTLVHLGMLVVSLTDISPPGNSPTLEKCMLSLAQVCVCHRLLGMLCHINLLYTQMFVCLFELLVHWVYLCMCKLWINHQNIPTANACHSYLCSMCKSVPMLLCCVLSQQSHQYKMNIDISLRNLLYNWCLNQSAVQCDRNRFVYIALCLWNGEEGNLSYISWCLF